jgi:ActD protein
VSSFYGYMAQFDRPEALLQAAKALRSRGYTRLEAHTPYPVEGLTEVLGIPPSRIPRAMLAGGLLAAFGTLAMQYYSAVFDYPINVGGRPDASWPTFIPAAVEMALLGASLFGLVAMFWGSGLPRLHHPVFEVEGFDRATRDAHFLVVLAEDPRCNDESIVTELRALDPIRVERVPE